MAAGRVACHVESVLVHAVVLGVQPEPAARAQYLPNDLLHADLRAQVVVDDGERDAAVDQGRGEIGEIALVERTPVAAMDEHEAATVAFASREQVHRFSQHVAVAQVQVRSHPVTRQLRFLGPAREVLPMIGNELPVVVQARKLGRVDGSHPPRRSRQSPIASCPGRSENENRTHSLCVWKLTGIQEGTTKVSRGSNSNFLPPMPTVPAPSTTE